MEELKKQIEDLPQQTKALIDIYFNAHNLAVNTFSLLDEKAADLVMKYINSVMTQE